MYYEKLFEIKSSKHKIFRIFSCHLDTIEQIILDPYWYGNFDIVKIKSKPHFKTEIIMKRYKKGA